jgi:hypothetical protein
MKLTFVGNLITLPYSPDHAGVRQGMEYLKETGKISGYNIVEPHIYGNRNQDFANAVAATNPDIVIHGMTDSLSQIIPPMVKQQLPNVIQIFSMWDYRPDNLQYDGLWERWKQSAPALDLITLSNKNQLAWWKDEFETETMYWPHGCVIQEPQYDEKYAYDCVFVGGRNDSWPYSERVKLIDEISEHINVEWINAPGGDSNSERIQIWKNLPKIYHSAKTVLDISHFWDADGYASGRYFYSAGLGGCSITKRFPGCEDLYPDNTKIYFDTPEEAIEKIKFYVENEKKGDKVKSAAQSYTKENHSYMKRFDELWSHID